MGDHAGTGPGGGRRDGPFLLAGAELIMFNGVAMTVPPELPAGPPSAETLRRILSAAARDHLDIAPPPKPEK